MDEQLLPCPFCGQSQRASVAHESFTDYCWVECICGASGPESSSPETARAFWNQRRAVSASEKP
jgi:Lar family restriction alleviation protein